jgi:hypothetical protein
MPKGVRWSSAEEQTLRHLVAAGHTNGEIADAMGKPRSAIENKVRRLDLTTTNKRHNGPRQPSSKPVPSAESLEIEGDEDSVTIRSTSARIHTIEGALEKAGIDTSIWEVHHQRVKAYEGYMKDGNGEAVVVPMFSVEVKVRRNKQADALISAGERVIGLMDAHAPQYAPRIYAATPKASMLAEHNWTDLHVGKVPLDPNDVRGEDVFRSAVEYMIGKATREPVARNLVPFGSDFTHIDNLARTTTRGTQQTASADWEDLFVLMYELMVWGIDRLLEVAPVDLVVYRGNHGRQTEFSLAHALKAHYRNCKHVTVDNDKRWRKYYRYHRNLLGFTHGDREKHADLPLLMAQERPEDWAATEFREIHVGHLHHRKEIQWLDVDEKTGVILRQLQSLSPQDFWHHQQGYFAMRSANCFVWHPEHGMVDNIPVPLCALLPATDRAA